VRERLNGLRYKGGMKFPPSMEFIPAVTDPHVTPGKFWRARRRMAGMLAQLTMWALYFAFTSLGVWSLVSGWLFLATGVLAILMSIMAVVSAFKRDGRIPQSEDPY
jgi:hypothetical protein